MAYQGYNSRLQGNVDILGNVDVLGTDPYELLGLDDLVGSDLEVLGAIRRARAARGGAARGSGAASNAVRHKEPDESRKLSLPIDSGTTIAALATSVISVPPVEPFRGESLSVDPTIAPAFIINSVLVGRKNQLIGSGSLACTLCSPTNPHRVQWDTAQTSQPILISVTNTSAAALRFMGQVVGTTVTS